MSDQAPTLLDRIEAICAARGWAETTFGMKAVRDSTFVQRLRERRVTLVVVDRAEAFILAEEQRLHAPADPVSQEAPAA